MKLSHLLAGAGVIATGIIATPIALLKLSFDKEEQRVANQPKTSFIAKFDSLEVSKVKIYTSAKRRRRHLPTMSTEYYAITSEQIVDSVNGYAAVNHQPEEQIARCRIGLNENTKWESLIKAEAEKIYAKLEPGKFYKFNCVIDSESGKYKIVDVSPVPIQSVSQALNTSFQDIDSTGSKWTDRQAVATPRQR